MPCLKRSSSVRVPAALPAASPMRCMAVHGFCRSRGSAGASKMEPPEMEEALGILMGKQTPAIVICGL